AQASPESGRLAVRSVLASGRPEVAATTFTPDGRTLVLVRQDGTVETWDIAARRLRATLTERLSTSDTLFDASRNRPERRGKWIAEVVFAFSEHGKMLAIADGWGKVLVLDDFATPHETLAARRVTNGLWSQPTLAFPSGRPVFAAFTYDG